MKTLLIFGITAVAFVGCDKQVSTPPTTETYVDQKTTTVATPLTETRKVETKTTVVPPDAPAVEKKTTTTTTTLK